MTDPKVLVLVADDNPGIRETTSMILKSAGYAVTEALDGEDAAEKLTAQRYDVAVLDVRMPKRDGISVVENLHPRPPPPAVILASAYSFHRDVRGRLGSRVFCYLRKPVPPVDLLEAVGQAARSGSSQVLG